MNSDLVYKKKYLKYKSKYIALQRQLNVQEGGWPSLTTFSRKSKLGIYLFFVYDRNKYEELLDGMKLLKEEYFKDSGSEISKKLGQGCWYLERKMDVLGKFVGKLDEELVGKVILKSCASDSTVQEVKGARFKNEMTTINSIMPILRNIRYVLNELTHYFVVDFNALKYNRISCLFEMPELALLQGATTYDADASIQKPSHQVVQNLPPGAPGYGASPQGAYGAPQASAPPIRDSLPSLNLTTEQLAQLKQRYNNPQYTDQYWQEQWQEDWRGNLKYNGNNITPDEFVQYQLSRPPQYV
jgi:hypothetical protein